MMPSLFVLCLAAAALVAFSSSALTALALRMHRHALEARSPAAQARVLLAAALVPGIITLAIITAALAPSFGWIADHCHAGAEVHAHPHICGHHDAVLPALPILLLAAALIARVLGTLLQVTRLFGSAWRARHLAGRATAVAGSTLTVLPLDGAQAFVLGILKPKIFVTRGLLELSPETFNAVVAHERAHLRRADSLRRLLAGFALTFHLPGVAASIEKQLAHAHERAADEEAASELGSRTTIADALVSLTRSRLDQTRLAVPSAGLAFGGSGVEARVRALLEAPSKLEDPKPAHLLATFATGLVVVALSADTVHHGVEIALGLVGG